MTNQPPHDYTPIDYLHEIQSWPQAIVAVVAIAAVVFVIYSYIKYLSS